MGKLHGLLVDRKESGAPGDFSALKTPEEIIKAIRDELGDGAASLLQAMLANKQAAQEPAEEVTEAVPEDVSLPPAVISPGSDVIN